MEQVIAYFNAFPLQQALQAVSGLNLYILLPVCFAVVALTISYFRNYHFPAKWLRFELIKIITQVKLARTDDEISTEALKAKLDEMFDKSPFKNIWAEYSQSLHKVFDSENSNKIKNIYATAPSVTFFSKETLIDIQINAGFYRHLPGILTGIGIIGTFTGLVWGLYEFRLDEGLALESLPLLLQEVASAFIGSGLAILAAIFITYKEKDIINQCYMLVDELNKELDSLYSMGVGEEYLSRLVKVSENNPLAIQDFKESLLTSLAEMNKKQIEEQRVQGQFIADQVAGAIKGALAEPMKDLSIVLREVRGDQKEAVSETMESLISGFMAKLGDTVGDQIEGINSSIKTSSEALNQVQLSMSQSAESISTAGTSAASTMSEKIEDVFVRMLTTQEKMNSQMMEDQKQLSEAMDESMKSVLSSINDSVISMAIERKQQIKQEEERHNMLLQSVKDAVSSLSEERTKQMQQDEERSSNLITSMDKLYSDLSINVENIASDIKEATFKTAHNFETMQQMTINVLSQMKDGAEVVNDAAYRFSEAGNKMSGLTAVMESTANAMSTTSSAVKDAFEEYDRSRGAVIEQVSLLQSLVATVKEEAGVKKQLVEDMETIVGSLAMAERQSTEYLESINAVLKESFQDFGSEMVNQVRNISAESNRQLGSSLNALSGTVDSMVSSVTKLRRAA